MNRLLAILILLCATAHAATFAELAVTEFDKGIDEAVRRVYYGPDFIGPICPVFVPYKPNSFEWQFPTNSSVLLNRAK